MIRTINSQPARAKKLYAGCETRIIKLPLIYRRLRKAALVLRLGS